MLGVLTEALELALRVPMNTVGAGRTDAGVHAWGQVVSCEIDSATDLDALSRRLNKLCGPEIAVRAIGWAPEGFHARFSALARRYRYHIWNDPTPHPLAAGRSWHLPQPLQMWALQAAGDPLLGEHDFSTFCRRPPDGPDGQPASLLRKVTDVRWSRLGSTPMLRLEIAATAFCHQMVRSLVGTMVEVGLARRTPAEMTTLLRARDRSLLTKVAPPEGLVLHEVEYADGAARPSTWLAQG